MMSKRLIVMIILVFVFFSGQFLEAQSPCGYSYYPGIETPHPYGKVKKGEIIWSDIIYQGGASWIKIHFTDFYLDDDDYVDLIDKNGAVVVRIKGSDVSNDASSIYKVIPTGKKKVSFWAPAVDGDMLSVELKRGASKYKGKKWGFTIDEVGVGWESLFEEEAVIEWICWPYDLQDIECYNGEEPYDRGQAAGRTYFRINGAWYHGNGFLISCNKTNHFLTVSENIFHQHIVNTLEVQFDYQYTTCEGSTLKTPRTTYFGDDLVDFNDEYKYCLLTLKGDPQSNVTPLKPHSRDPKSEESIYLVQHPRGIPKKIGFGNVSDTGDTSMYFYHYIDTSPYPLGSKGAPILSYDEKNNGNDKVLGFDYGGNCPNRAVKIFKICDNIKTYIGCD